jgi:tungstate transport system substrate-binding protein
MYNYFKNIIYLLVISLFFLIQPLANEQNVLWIQSTTSTRDSGLYNFIIPKFEEKYNIKVFVVAVGTGQALQNAKNCDGDILIVHATDLERKFINDGYGISRSNLMYNDFIIIGPANNPADINIIDKIPIVFNKISKTNVKFISRGDSSGTHLAEMNLWDMARIDPSLYSGKWYLSTGQGMGSTLNIAVGLNAYTFTDRATWIRFNNKENHQIIFENDPNLFNQYGVVKINPKHCKNLNHSSADLFHDWVLSKEGQDLIAEFTLNGRQLFTPNYINSNN